MKGKGEERKAKSLQHRDGGSTAGDNMSSLSSSGLRSEEEGVVG